MNIEIKNRGSTPGAAEGSPSEIAAVASSDAARLADLERELSQTRDRWMRSEVEIANVRTRARRDVDEARQFAVQKFATPDNAAWRIWPSRAMVWSQMIPVVRSVGAE